MRHPWLNFLMVGGGVLPAHDDDVRFQNDRAAIFGPGTVIPDSARKILHLLLEQVS